MGSKNGCKFDREEKARIALLELCEEIAEGI